LWLREAAPQALVLRAPRAPGGRHPSLNAVATLDRTQDQGGENALRVRRGPKSEGRLGASKRSEDGF